MAGILRYANQGATRNLPLVPGLASNLEQAISAVYGPGAYLQVYSGGQPGKGEGGARTGSIRHDHGRAADIRVFGADGNQITGDGLAPLGQYWRANNFGGVGMEMHGGGIHLDDWAKPPPGGGMNWNYANQGGRYTDAMASAIAAGNKGVMPTLLGSVPPTSSTPSAPEQTGDDPVMAYNNPRKPSPAMNAIDQQTTGSTAPLSLPASLPTTADAKAQDSSILGKVFGIDTSSPQWLMAVQMIMNGQKPPGQGFDGVPEIAAYGARMKASADEKAKDALQRNQTYQFMVRKAPDIAQAMLGGLPAADAYNLYYKQTDPSAQLDMKYKQAQIDALSAKPVKQWQRLDDNTLFNPETGETRAVPRDPNAPAGDLGLNPQYGVDENNNPVLLQLGKNGKVVQSQLPAGVTLSKEPIKLDAGTHYVLLDPITRQPVGQIPKDLSGAESDKAAGKAQGEAQAALPVVEGAANELLSTVDSLYNDPYLGSMLGPVNSRLPNVFPDAARVQSKMDQIGGQTFLQAFNTLRGAGQITEVEGAKATAAMARLNTAQSEKDYKAALDELRGVVTRAVDRARQKAGQSGATPQAPQPQTKDGWQDVGGGVKIRLKGN